MSFRMTHVWRFTGFTVPPFLVSCWQTSAAVGRGCGDGYGLLRGGLEQRAELGAEFVLGEEDVPSNADAIDLAPIDLAADCRFRKRRQLRGLSYCEQLRQVYGHQD